MVFQVLNLCALVLRERHRIEELYIRLKGIILLGISVERWGGCCAIDGS